MFWLNKRSYKVMSSLFGHSQMPAGILKWRDFVSAMAKLGFKCSPAPTGGPRRVFRAVDAVKLPPFAWDEPHGKRNGDLSLCKKARLARELQQRYGWDEKTFRLKRGER
ncbi:hypothetical protein OH77DRAFT_1324685 [Trametes cingulata]|nr:hypothetical protein OH77DRAFT_1324685 [Trametes cingulata]